MTATSENRSLTGNFKSAIIRAGEVELRKISPYLADLPEGAKAQLLVAPQGLDKIDGGNVGDWWKKSIERVRNIKNYHGLDGMQIFDRPESAPDVSYEQDWANQITALFNQAHSTGQIVVSPLFIAPIELLHGKERGQDLHFPGRVTMPTNLYSLRNAIAEQSDVFVVPGPHEPHYGQWSCTELPDSPHKVYHVNFRDKDTLFPEGGEADGEYKRCGLKETRPVALEIIPG